jgi:hypothetical protein
VLSLRIFTISAVFLTLAASSASAQTGTTTVPGKPLALLQIYQKNDGTAAVKTHRRARYVHRRVATTRVANQTTGDTRHAYMEVQPAPEAAQTSATPLAVTAPEATPAAATPLATNAAAATTPVATTTAAAANIWPGPDLTPPGMQGQTLALTPSAPPFTASNEPGAANSNEMLTAPYQTVQVTPPSAAQADPPDAAQVTPPNAVNLADSPGDHQQVVANTAGANDAGAGWPVQHAMVATAEPQNPNPVGSPIWIAHVLAALGGAIAAGGLAWFLINPLPVRSYE